MKRARKSEGAYTALPKAITRSAAWRAMSFGARLLHIEFRGWLRNDRLNNGHLFLSCRSAANAMGASRTRVTGWYAENEHFGFLRKTAEGFLGSDGRGIAAKYRFTDLAYGTHPPTRDYEKWEGQPFVYTPRRPDRKKQNPVRKKRTPRPQKADIQQGLNGSAVCPQKEDIGKTLGCPQKADTSRVPFPPAGRAKVQGSSTVRAPAQAGGAGSSPAPVASLTEYVLNVVNAELDRAPRPRDLWPKSSIGPT
jgi:hypothetical protein